MNTVKPVILANDRIGYLVSNGDKSATFDYNGWYCGIPIKSDLNESHKRSMRSDSFQVKQIKHTLLNIDIPPEGIDNNWSK